MQSSVRADAPRFPRPPSIPNDSVQISRAVSIASSRASSPRRRGSYSTMPPTYNTHARKHNGSDESSAAGMYQRWNSRTSVRSTRSSVGSTVRLRTPDPELLDSNRESMRALAEFLMTKEPPPNHYMSMDPSIDGKALSPFKTAFKIMGRNKRRKRRSQPLLQLPDSAVAAKTSSGARYIAISIPLEYDWKDHSIERHLPPPRSSSQRTIDRLDRSAVTVLKPVHELHESISSRALGVASDDVVQQSPPATALVNAPLSDIVGGQMHFNQPNQQQWKLLPGDQLPKRDINRAQKSYIAVPPFDIHRQQEADPRHSGGTAYSTTSITTPLIEQTRGFSEPSGTTVYPPPMVDLPLRNSSIVPKPQHAEHKLNPLKMNPIRWSAGPLERAQTSPVTSYEKSRGHARGSSALSGIESLATMTSTGSTPSPPIVFTADVARKYSNAANGAGPQLVRSFTPLMSRSGTPMPRPKTAPPGTLSKPDLSVPLSHFNHNSDMARRTASQRIGNVIDPHQSRQDRVKARKMHDVANARPRSSGHLSREIPNGIFELPTNSPRGGTFDKTNVTTDNNTPTAEPKTQAKALQDETTPPKRSPRRRRNSQELAFLRSACTLSPIMLVVHLAPYTPLTISDSPIQTSTSTPSTVRQLPGGSNRDSANRNSTGTVIHLGKFAPSQASNKKNKDKSIHTPPRSHSSSPGPSSLSHHSSSDLDYEFEAERSRLARLRAISHQSLRSTLLSTRRQERRAKRNSVLREKDLDTRMLRIERENRMLLRTLGLVADSFEEVRERGRVEERGKQSLDVGDGADREMEMVEAEREEKRRLAELEGMEPVMRELVGGMNAGNAGVGWRRGGRPERLFMDFSEEGFGG